MNVDLPYLTSIINPKKRSFSNPRVVKLKNIPNLRNVKLPGSFKKVHHPIVNNVSELLFPKVYYFDFIQSIDSSITSIIIPNWTCNDIDYTIFDFSRFTRVRSIEIGDDCFESVQTFQIDGLDRLKTIKIGKNSFTQVKESDWDNNRREAWNRTNKQSKSFHILNCKSLESIQIGKLSFSDFAGEFELKNLPQLQSIQFDSYNICLSSFVVRDLPNLQSITLGDRAFQASLSTIIENLPSLQSITLGRNALEGRDDDSCSLIMRNLPYLTSIINPKKRSFSNPRVVKLKNIPNLRNVKLPGSFKKVHHPIVNSTILYYILNIDVSELLFPKVYYFDFIQSIDSSITSIIIPNWTCNDIDYTIFDFSRFSVVESIEIGNDCFGSVKTFKIEGLNRLKTIKIGINSFTHKKNSARNDSSKSFHILNCESLKSIQIGHHSFSDYAGEFELKNLPQLQSIQIGKTGLWSYNFYYNSFVIRDLPNLQSITLGDGAFGYSLSTIIENLPSLKSITLGYEALYGRWKDDSCSLTMRNLPNLTSIINSGSGGSFHYPRSVTLENIPNLQNVNLFLSFQSVRSKSILNVSSILAGLVKINPDPDVADLDLEAMLEDL